MRKYQQIDVYIYQCDCWFLDHTYLNVFEKLEVLALDYTYHTQPGRIRLVMDISQIKAYLK